MQILISQKVFIDFQSFAVTLMVINKMLASFENINIWPSYGIKENHYKFIWDRSHIR